MAKRSKGVEVYLETGKKRVFASAIEWPGWTRVGRDEATAFGTLLAYAPRYERAIHSAGLDFHAPKELDEFKVVERVPGTSTTDFGAPDVPATADAEALDKSALERSQAILNACWDALASAYQAATGKELRKGPRGGGRDLDPIIHHIVDSHYGYLRAIGWKAKRDQAASIGETLNKAKKETVDALNAVHAGEIPEKGPRGGARWPARYFVRRAAWHLLDHLWEIEDRVT
jgi:hypothetical protein